MILDRETFKDCNVNDITEVRRYVIGDIDEKQYTLDAYYKTDILAKDVILKKYFAPTDITLVDMWFRVAWGTAQAEKEDVRVYWAYRYFNILKDFRFIPGGRINHGVGRNDIRVSFANCYVVPIKEDSLSGIYKCLQEEAMTYKVGGGCGHDLSILRPKDTDIMGTGGKSCGTTGFMNLFSVSTNTVSQQSRRGANMQTLLVSHPDIEDFIEIKNDIKECNLVLDKIAKTYKNKDDFEVLTNWIDNHRDVGKSNISVKLTDEFLNAVENNTDFNLTWNGVVYKTIKARDLWNKIIYNAWQSAEPGIIFWDRMVETNNLEYVNPLLSTNPCSELPLGAYGNCLLGHINLSAMVINGQFDLDLYEDTIAVAMRFLDDIITINDGRHALPEQNEIALKERRTGLGITGIGDMFIKLMMRYGDEESLEFADLLGEKLRNTAYHTSAMLAKEKGAFPWFDVDKFFLSKFSSNLPNHIKASIEVYGIRNGMLLTVAPVGTGSIIAQTSSGIEPIFRCSYTRNVKEQDGKSFKEYKVFHPLIENMFGTDINNYPECVVDSSMITPEERVRIQATIQKYIDNSISSTVNLPFDSKIEDVADVYMNAWKLGCKGITVYREGCRRGVLVSNDEANKKEEDVELDNNGNERYVMKRPRKLEGETYKLRLDLTGDKLNNCYVTVNFEPGTKKPFEMLLTEKSANKEFKDILYTETVMRLVSLCLRHNVPLVFIAEQLEKVQNQYIYSLPLSLSNVLRNYIGIDESLLKEEDYVEQTIPAPKKSIYIEKCPNCTQPLTRNSGCTSCKHCGWERC